MYLTSHLMLQLLFAVRNKSEFDSCAEALKIRLTPAEIDYLCLKTDKL